MTGGGTSANPAPLLHGCEIDALFEGWLAYRRVALAVSGGADSMALMLLAQDWVSRRENPPALTVLTVDHRLRREAADEAAWVKAQAARLGLPHETLAWTGEKPRSDLQAAARSARYGLMLAACRSAGIAALATAHTADDQAETVLMRLARGSGTDGLAGIPPVSSRDGVAVLRPLLNVTRARLEATLRESGQTWIEDPSNRDSHYERVRLRGGLKAAPGLGLTPDSLALSAKRLHRARLALEDMTNAFLHASLRVHPAGYGELDQAAFTQAPDEIGIRALASMAAMFGGGRRALRLARLETLHRALTQRGATASTLGGCVFAAARGVVRAAREFGRIDPARLALPAGAPLFWDGRFVISAVDENGLTAGPLGPDGVASLRAEGGRIALPAQIAHTLPAIWRGDRLAFGPFATFAEAPPNGWIANASAVFARTSPPLASTGTAQ